MIKRMHPGQVGAVRALLALCFGASAWSEDAVRSQLEKADAVCTVAVEDGAVVGYCAFEQIADEGSVVEVAVHPAYRRQGIARQLLREAMDDESLKEIFLEVRASNIPAVALYKSLGFERIGVRKGYYDHPKEDAVMMRKII